MAKAIGYNEMKKFILNNNCFLNTSKEEFESIRKEGKLPSQINLKITCSCGNPFVVSFNRFKSKNKRMCNNCSKIELNKIRYPKERVDEVLNLYKSGCTLSETGKKVGIKPEYVSRILKENGVKIRNSTSYRSSKELATNKKYEFNEDFFEYIDAEEKSYWLGFMYADGNVRVGKGGRIEISLKSEDKYHLYNFIRCLNGNMKVEDRVINLRGNNYNECRLSFGSVKMSKDLINHGCVPNKSLDLHFPSTIPSELLKHFIRGYFDGDGCVAFYVYDNQDIFNASFLGTYEFLSGLKSCLKSEGVNTSDIKKTKSKAFELYVYGRDNLVNFYNLCYANSNIFLGRKIDKFRQALIYFKKDFNITETSKLFYIFDDNLRDKEIIRNNR